MIQTGICELHTGLARRINNIVCCISIQATTQPSGVQVSQRMEVLWNAQILGVTISKSLPWTEGSTSTPEYQTYTFNFQASTASSVVGFQISTNPTVRV